MGKHSASPAPPASKAAVASNAAAAPKASDGRPATGDEGRHPRRSPRNVVSTLLIVAGVVLLLVAGGMFVRAQLQYRHQRQNNEALEKVADVKQDQTTGAPKIDWAALEAVNNDVVGWIDVEGTSMSFPVYQGKTNKTYLRTAATGEYSVGGQVFMDCDNTAPGMVDGQTLIYGHHLNDGQMFAPLDDLKEQGNFDKVKTVWYVDRNDKAYEMEPLLLYIIKSDYDNDLRTFNFSTEDDLHAYLKKMLAKAVARRADAEEAIERTSHACTLVTCNYDYGHGRAVLICVPKAGARQ